jgi:hypothetical protein
MSALMDTGQGQSSVMGISATQLKRLALEQYLLASQANQQLWMEQHRGEES